MGCHELRQPGGASCNNSKKQAGFFPNQEAVKVWMTLQIVFESRLELPTVAVKNAVKRSHTEVGECLQMNESVARGSPGMGFKIDNFHVALLVPRETLNFVGFRHTLSTPFSMKQCTRQTKARLGQHKKLPKTFDVQSAKQVDDRRVPEVSMQKLKRRPRWDHCVSFQCLNQHKSDRIVAIEAKRGAKLMWARLSLS